MKKPCNQCPFRKDTLKGWLNRRKHEIVSASISDDAFYCHKTLTHSDEEDDTAIGAKSQICAGSVLLHVKEGCPNRYYRYIQHEYEGAELVFDSAKDFIEHHTE